MLTSNQSILLCQKPAAQTFHICCRKT